MPAKDTISWLKDLNEAKNVSSGSDKPILMFFHYERCTGCRKTIADTLPKMSVVDAVNEGYVPVMLDTEKHGDLVKSYGVDWTPTFLVADSSGKETFRWVGYLPEDDFLGQLNMALAMSALKKGEYKDAERHFDEVMIKYPLTELAPEACYYIGVCRYRDTGDASWLSRTYENMKEAYPDSPWTMKASAWSPEQARKAA